MKNRILAVLGVAMLSGGQSLAQTAAPESATGTELSKEIENPVTRRITLPLRYEAEFLDGAYKATKDTFEIDQAVVPFRLNEDWALITRTKLPLEAVPPKKLGESWAFGLRAHPNHKRICDEVCPAICNIFTGEDRVGDLRRSGDVERGVALIDADRPP
jgi:hypothetical protein